MIEAADSGDHHIEIWGDGHQTRSFMYIDDCTLGIDQIMHYREAYCHTDQSGLERADID